MQDAGLCMNYEVYFNGLESTSLSVNVNSVWLLVLITQMFLTFPDSVAEV